MRGEGCRRALNIRSSDTPIGTQRTSAGWVSGCTSSTTGTVSRLPEAALAGAAAAIFTSTGQPGGEATLDQSGQFLTAYATARGRPWTTSEYEVCWAAGLWTRAFDAKKEAVTQGGGPLGERLRIEAPERLRRSGLT